MTKPTDDEWIWGRHSVEACLDCHPEGLTEIFLEKTAASKHKDLEKKISDSGLNINRVEKLPRFLADKRSQGWAAKIKKYPIQHFRIDHEVFENHRNHQGVIIDRVQDPQNFGAILRSAAALNAAFVLIGVREQCPVNGTVAQVSAGNLFRLQIFTSLNVAKSAEELKEKGYTLLALESEGTYLDRVLSADKSAKKLVWIVGSEEEGIQSSLVKVAQHKVGIPMREGVESLNVSNSAAIALYLGYQALRE